METDCTLSVLKVALAIGRTEHEAEKATLKIYIVRKSMKKKLHVTVFSITDLHESPPHKHERRISQGINICLN